MILRMIADRADTDSRCLISAIGPDQAAKSQSYNSTIQGMALIMSAGQNSTSPQHKVHG